jgi:hypothetical protein
MEKVTYRLYYHDNDRQLIVIRTGLSYELAWREANRLEKIYNTTIHYGAELK